MKKRNITITLEKAIEWYNSDDESLRDLALQAFTKEELIYNFSDITTFKKACDALGYNYDDIVSKVDTCGMSLNGNAAWSLSGIMDLFTFVDGTTFGVKVEE